MPCIPCIGMPCIPCIGWPCIGWVVCAMASDGAAVRSAAKPYAINLDMLNSLFLSRLLEATSKPAAGWPMRRLHRSISKFWSLASGEVPLAVVYDRRADLKCRSRSRRTTTRYRPFLLRYLGPAQNIGNGGDSHQTCVVSSGQCIVAHYLTCPLAGQLRRLPGSKLPKIVDRVQSWFNANTHNSLCNV